MEVYISTYFFHFFFYTRLIFVSASKVLPKFQPIQECPGFKCETGISKCLPNKRKCDRIVDCLDGEDETQCEYTKTVSTLADSIFVDKSSLEELLEKKEVLTESTSITSSNINQKESTSPKIPSDKTVTSTEVIDASDPSEKSTNTEQLDLEDEQNPFKNSQSQESNEFEKQDLENEKSLSSHQNSRQSNSDKKRDMGPAENPANHSQTKESTDAQKLDFENGENPVGKSQLRESADAENTGLKSGENLKSHVQSKEVINDEGINLSISEETSTDDPKSMISRETPSPNRGDTEMITLDFSVESLESGSSVLERLKETTTTKLSTSNIFEDSKITKTLETSTSAFTYNDFIEPIDKKEPTTRSPFIKQSFEDNVEDQAENKSGLRIKLLPVMNATESDQEDIEKIFTNDDRNITDSHHHEEPSAKILPEFNNTSDPLNQIEDIFSSELEPAKIRRKHRVPNEFECRR